MFINFYLLTSDMWHQNSKYLKTYSQNCESLEMIIRALFWLIFLGGRKKEDEVREQGEGAPEPSVRDEQ